MANDIWPIYAVLAGKSLCVQSPNKFLVFDTASGKLIYSFLYKDFIKSDNLLNPQVLEFISDHHIVLFSHTNNYMLYCINKENSKIQWKKIIQDDILQIGNCSGCLPYMHAKIDNTIIYVNENAIYLIDLKTGKDKKIKLTGTPILNYFIKENEALYILDKEAKLQRFSLQELQNHSRIKL